MLLEERPLRKLTARELEILHLIRGGQTTSQIALSLAISRETVATYRQAIRNKLHAHGRSDIVVTAIHLGILEPVANL